MDTAACLRPKRENTRSCIPGLKINDAPTKRFNNNNNNNHPQQTAPPTNRKLLVDHRRRLWFNHASTVSRTNWDWIWIRAPRNGRHVTPTCWTLSHTTDTAACRISIRPIPNWDGGCARNVINTICKNPFPI